MSGAVKSTADMMAAELRMYWCLGCEARQLREQGDAAGLPIVQDELECLVMHSDWKQLRRVATARIGALYAEPETSAA